MPTEETPIQLPIPEVAQEKIDELADKNANSIDSSVRYSAYGARLRTALRASSRYFAYTSDLGEAFRPIVPPWVVTAAYGVSWTYVAGDVAFETWKAKRLGPNPFEEFHFSESARLSMVALKRGTFQAVASMGLPAFTIHTIVKQSRRAFVNSTNPRIKTWGPTVSGLAVVPLLPYMFDEPVEYMTDSAFKWVQERMAGVPIPDEEHRPR